MRLKMLMHRDAIEAMGSLSKSSAEELQEIPHPLPADQQPPLQLLGQQVRQPNPEHLKSFNSSRICYQIADLEANLARHISFKSSLIEL